MAKKNFVEEEHAALLFIYRLYNTEEVQRLGICGEKRINNYIQSMDIGNESKVKQKDGHWVFKFGGGTCLNRIRGKVRI